MALLPKRKTTFQRNVSLHCRIAKDWCTGPLSTKLLKELDRSGCKGSGQRPREGGSGEGCSRQGGGSGEEGRSRQEGSHGEKATETGSGEEGRSRQRLPLPRRKAPPNAAFMKA